MLGLSWQPSPALTELEEVSVGRVRQMVGLQGEGRPLAAYVSAQSHSSVDKAALLAGFGRDNLRLVGCDGTLAMRPDAWTRPWRHPWGGVEGEELDRRTRSWAGAVNRSGRA